MNKKQFEKAVNIMNQAINLNSKNPDFYNNLGMCYSKMFKYKKANETYQKD